MQVRSKLEQTNQIHQAENGQVSAAAEGTRGQRIQIQAPPAEPKREARPHSLLPSPLQQSLVTGTTRTRAGDELLVDLPRHQSVAEEALYPTLPFEQAIRTNGCIFVAILVRQRETF